MGKMLKVVAVAIRAKNRSTFTFFPTKYTTKAPQSSLDTLDMALNEVVAGWIRDMRYFQSIDGDLLHLALLYNAGI